MKNNREKTVNYAGLNLMRQMRKLLPILFTWFFLVTIPDSFSQIPVEIDNVGAVLQGNGIKITYDLSDYQAGDSYEVWVEIADKNGNILNVRTVTGDVGSGVTGGPGKEILWNNVVDGIVPEVGIYIQVLAKPIKPPLSQTPAESNSVSGSGTAEKHVERKFSKTGLVLQSLVLPGLGLSRASGKPHWLRGVAGYACIGSTLAFNRMSISSFDAYREEFDMDTRNDLYDKVEIQNNVSEICAYAAIGIWLTDLIWNLVGVSNLDQAARINNSNRFYIEPGYDTWSGGPTLAINYTF